MSTDDDGIMVPVWLSTQQVSQVRALAGVCEGRDGYSMEARLDFGTLETRCEGPSSDVLWYENGQLVGFAGMYGYGDPSKVEASILVLSLIHISEPTRLGMISYAVFCLKKKKTKTIIKKT